MNFKVITTYILIILLGGSIGTFMEYATGSFRQGMFAAFIYGLLIAPQLAKLILQDSEEERSDDKERSDNGTNDDF